MTFQSLFWRIELRAVAALVTAIALAVVGAAIVGMWQSPTGVRFWNSVAVAYLLFVFGLLPVLLYGAPVYTLAVHKRWISWPMALLLGAAPGIGLLLWDRETAWFFLVLGPATAALTHAYARSLRQRYAAAPM